MDINNLRNCISHDEATIRSFVRNPDFANFYLQTVLQDGDEEEIAEVQAWYNEAKARRSNAAYWDNLADNVKIAVKSGINLDLILSRLNDATKTVKAAMA